MNKKTIQPVKGTRDFYPEEMSVRVWLYEKIKKVSRAFGYEEWEGPLIEPFSLYTAKSGDDLVKENFVFPDRGGEMISLRPELTPSLARMVAKKQRQLVYPLRWWSFGPFWRYERPQKGRTREFFQWNIDMIGTDSPIADAELIAIGASFLREVGLSPLQVRILVNNRQLMENELEKLGVSVDMRVPVFRLIDRKEKLPFDAWSKYALEIGLSSAQIEDLEGLLSNHDLWKLSATLVNLFASLDSLGVSEWVTYDPKIIRGLDYYTGTVFEAWDNEGEFRAILGGGRYDNLVQDVGGDPVEAVGFAMGDVIMSLVLEKFGCVPSDVNVNPAHILITIFDDPSLPDSLNLAAELRAANINVIVFPEVGKLAKQFKYGDRLGIRLAAVLGPDEIKNGMVALKNLMTGEQTSVSKEMVVDEIKKLILS